MIRNCFVWFVLVVKIVTFVFASDITQDADSTSLNGFSIANFVTKFGYHLETHQNIETPDGYLLTIHRLPAKTPTSRPPVFLMHGLGGCAPNWLLRGPGKALAFILAERGHDVWMGNARGTTYSKRHVSLSASSGRFWDFSWHEIGVHDLPTMLRYVLTQTNNTDLFYVGHSQGCTTFFVMAAMRPETNTWIRGMVALAPAVFCHNATLPSGYGSSILIELVELQRKALDINEVSRSTFNQICKTPLASVLSRICITYSRLFLQTGSHFPLNDTEFELFKETFPDSTSIRQHIHYMQLLVSGDFAQYNFGLSLNSKTYGSVQPPSYNLKEVTASISLYLGQADNLVTIDNSKRLARNLRNLAGFNVVADSNFNHLDFILGKEVEDLVYMKVIKEIENA